ncbi:MAG TPA: questin oxidase family protein [Actinophytocola sp.]|uniref:questin oxidase family protein n=1 Tax=Actinophytocola sp. TaxID=1872138 RepID=UPI002DDD70B3|nr:questin oxidase family protein [Actinophytocola sp.]HEV2778762.1 questin oxidase family protein [Actinophytocola sp.]
MNAILDEAYHRLHSTGPEWGGNLSNHGPMAAEVLVRRGREEQVPAWVDAYIGRLDKLPGPTEPITDANWREALSDFGRVGDWVGYFGAQVRERPWREVLATWWPRLLPGIVAGATHGVIRVSHAVRTLLAGDESLASVTELAHGLGWWAARSTAVPGFAELAGSLEPADALESVPRIPDQSGVLAERFGQLGALPSFSRSLAALRPPADPDDARDRLADLVDAATLKYLTHGHGSPVLLVHTATAPNAVLHTLPALPRELWPPSLTAAWAASAAIISTYAPVAGAPREALPEAPNADDPVAEVLDRAAANGDEHVIKFTDTAAEVFNRTGNPDALAASLRVGQLIGG